MHSGSLFKILEILLMKIPDYIPAWHGQTNVVTRTMSMLGAPVLALAAKSRADGDIHLAGLESILIVRLDEIGDVVLTTPFIRELRRNAPLAWITLVVNPKVANLVEDCPYVDEILTFDPRAERPALLRLSARALRMARKSLWRRRFDLAVVPRFDVDHFHATFLGYFSGAANRVAYSERVSSVKHRLNTGYDRLLTRAIDGAEGEHEVLRNLNVLSFLGGIVRDDRLELWLRDTDRSYADLVVKSRGVRDGEFLVAFAPGAADPKRRWSPDRLVELGRHVLTDLSSHLVVVGGPGEQDLGSLLEDKLGSSVINLTGRSSLRETAAILGRCGLTVTSDSGPMHLAAAAGSAVVEISCHPRTAAPDHCNSPVRFRPWGVPSVVLQPEKPLPPCVDACEAKTAHCILGVTVEQVCEAIDTLTSKCSIAPKSKAAATHAN